MLLCICVAFSLLLLQTGLPQTQPLKDDNSTGPAEEVKVPSKRRTPRRIVFVKKDWDITRAYTDVFTMLSDQNACSRFYGGPGTATTVLNDFVTRVKSERLMSDVSFQMAGRSRVIHDSETGASYRLFERTFVNTEGSFYQRRSDSLRRFPSNVGKFPPGSRQAKALILLHELGHLIMGDDGSWLIPDDGHNNDQSQANTLRVQQECQKELNELK